MNNKKLSLFIFIDAFGWEILKNMDFLNDALPQRKKLESILGYSSTAVPTILTGRKPNEHGHFSFYYYDPEHSPFKWLAPLRLVPDFFASRARIRNKISEVIKNLYGYTGYFQIYNMPFKYIHLFDYCEKKSIFAPDGILQGDNIFSACELAKIPYHVSDWRASEETNYQSVLDAIDGESVEWIFNYNAKLDGIMHVAGVGSDEALEQIDLYRKRLTTIFEHAADHYADYDLYVFSDHGMANTHTYHELWRDIDRLGYRFGKDYAAVYDSTMARFWFMNQDARSSVIDLLNQHAEGEILSQDTLERYGVYYPDSKYGELFFMLDEGHLIVPSFMGQRPITAMHGYHPQAPSSNASLMSSREIPEDIVRIQDIYKLMAAPLEERLRLSGEK